jgi:3'-5' exoribonuclease
VARSTPPLARLCDLAPRDYADFFALLASRTRNTTREGDPFYHCRFQDARRGVTFMVWANGPWFDVCENDWHEGLYYKIRGVYLEHEKYGPQIDIQNIRPVTEADRAEGFDERNLVEHSRRPAAEMLAELRALVETAIEDEPLRRLVLLVLERNAERLKRLPATRDKFYPFPGGWLEHTLLVTQHALLLADRYRLHYSELKPPLNKDLVVAGAVLHDIGRVLEYDESFPIARSSLPGSRPGTRDGPRSGESGPGHAGAPRTHPREPSDRTGVGLAPSPYGS